VIKRGSNQRTSPIWALMLWAFMALSSPAWAGEQALPPWYHEIQDMLEQDQRAAAASLLEITERRLTTLSDEQERIDALRHLSQLFYEFENRAHAAILLNEALDRSLSLQDIRAQLRNVSRIMQSPQLTDQTALANDLMAKLVKINTLKSLVSSRHSGLFVRVLESLPSPISADHFRAIITQLAQTATVPLMQRSLIVLAKDTAIQPQRVASGYSQTDQPLRLPIGLKLQDRLYWHAAVAKYYAATARSYRLTQEQSALKRIYDQLPKNRKPQYRTLYRTVTQL